MIREELALVKQNGAWKPRRKKGWSGLFYPPNGLNFQFCWFNLIFLIAPSWSESNFILFLLFYSLRVGPSRSDPDWRSELIRSDFCTCLILRNATGIIQHPFDTKARWTKLNYLNTFGQVHSMTKTNLSPSSGESLSSASVFGADMSY